MAPVRVALVGLGGYGAVHARELARLVEAGVAELVGGADVAEPGEAAAQLLATGGGRLVADYRRLFDAGAGPEVVVLATPPHLHHEMAVHCAAAGAHVYLEKPPVATLDELASLERVLAEHGRLCQVGFQSTGSGALGRLAQVAAEWGSGAAVFARGHWRRDAAYWSRAAWAGRRRLGGRPVPDGALTNPFAHAVMICLAVLGARTPADVSHVACARYRANEIEVDDTAALEATTARGSFRVAVTLCAEQVSPPDCVVRLGDDEYRWDYLGDELERRRGGAPAARELYARKSLLEELLRAVACGGGTLSCPLSATGAFVALTEAVTSAPVHPVPPALVSREGEGERAIRRVRGIDRLVDDAAAGGRSFSAADRRWAPPTAVDLVRSRARRPSP